jgi:hypothetical protein
MYRTQYTVHGTRYMWYDTGMQDRTAVLPFPVVGEITEDTWGQVSEGQPVLLVRHGRPAAVIVDLESWEEGEHAITQTG